MELWILFLVASFLSGVGSARRGAQVPVIATLAVCLLVALALSTQRFI